MRADGIFIERRGRRRRSPTTRAGAPSSPRSARSTSSPSTAATRVEIVEENLDECVLCGLCLDAAPDGTVRVLKLYDEGAALEHA